MWVAWSLQGITDEWACGNVHIAHFTVCWIFFLHREKETEESFISPLNQILQRKRPSLPFCGAAGKAEVKWGEQKL